jgi:hypothetical protein
MSPRLRILQRLRNVGLAERLLGQKKRFQRRRPSAFGVTVAGAGAYLAGRVANGRSRFSTDARPSDPFEDSFAARASADDPRRKLYDQWRDLAFVATALDELDRLHGVSGAQLPRRIDAPGHLGDVPRRDSRDETDDGDALDRRAVETRAWTHRAVQSIRARFDAARRALEPVRRLDFERRRAAELEARPAGRVLAFPSGNSFRIPEAFAPGSARRSTSLP